MSGQSTSTRMPKSSPNLVKQGPLKATIPISSVMKPSSNLISSSSSSSTVSPTYFWRNRGSPDQTSGQRSPGSVGYKEKPKSSRQEDGPGGCMRRTASMDAIYLKGHWPRDGFYWRMSTLQVNEATQTDESELSDSRQMHCISEIDDKPEKLTVRSKIWNTKELGVRHDSPGEHTLNTSSQTISSKSYSSPVPINLKPIPKQALRSSVEGLNQEIERLVLKTDVEAHSGRSYDIDRYSETIPEGHRAPVADIFKFAVRSRSVDTQTPHNFGTSSNSSGESQGSSPDQEASKLGSSPQINRFLAREPPDGCEKVQSKSLIDKKLFPLEHIPQPCTFKLKPSLGSAFHILQPVRNENFDQDLPIVPSEDDN